MAATHTGSHLTDTDARMSLTVRQATIHDLDLIAPLFDAYRVFYGQPTDVDAAARFLRERFQHHESVVLLALDGEGEGVGFVQLYPLFTSVRLARLYLLNDLFVASGARQRGVGAALMHEATDFARAVGAAGMTLTTAHTNVAAQRLYESLGWKRDEEFREYSLRF
jgi:ribosomal protein S18 acetylase RimI-like enzyme